MNKIQIAWSDDLSVGDHIIDEEHKLFIDALNVLYLAIDDGGDFIAIENVLGRLVDLSSAHFAREERLMDRVRFPLRNKHAENHSRFLHALDVMLLSYENRELALVRATADGLRDLYLFHILTFDQLLRQHIIEVDQ